MKPVGDVVICTWGGDDPAVATQCIDLAARQAHESGGEVIVVDSWPDDTIRRAVDGQESVVVVDVEPGTLLGRARQAGLEASEARFVAFLDSDALPRSGWLRALLEGAQPEDVGVVGGPVLPLWPRRLPPLFNSQPAYDFLSMLDLGSQQLDVPRVMPGNMLVDRQRVGDSVFEAERGRRGGDLVGAEEAEMMIALVASGGRIVYVPTAVVDHHAPAERLSWQWMWRRAEAAGREAAMIGGRLEPLPRELSWQDRAFLALCAPAYFAGRLRSRRSRR